MVATGRKPGCFFATSIRMPIAQSGVGLPMPSSVSCEGEESSKVSTTGCLPAGMSIFPVTYSAAVTGT